MPSCVRCGQKEANPPGNLCTDCVDASVATVVGEIRPIDVELTFKVVVSVPPNYTDEDVSNAFNEYVHETGSLPEPLSVVPYDQTPLVPTGISYRAIKRDDDEIICQTREEFARTISEFILSDPGGNEPDDDGKVWLELWVSDE